MHILGTAGHVDHGKSSLVRALTGTDPDRLIEEQLRGMTLDLGFAHLRFPDGVEAGVVDVPGHERFLHNMLAGAAGMELLLLVIAANEGPKPQTLDHLDILQYLNVRRTIVVLTKCDTVDVEELGYAREFAREALAGTFAEHAEMIPVSTLTGEGLERLLAAIHAALVELPPRAPQAPAYLPIDRVFALAGHGTIVTGTLMQGRIAAGDRLALTPPGREVRVRGLQVFGSKLDVAFGGSRVAVNLAGIGREDVVRGAVLASTQFEAHAAADVRFRALPQALGLLKRRTPVRAYVGSAEILGTLVFASPPENTGDVAARLYLREPAIVFPGAAFVVRRVSPKTLLGGGNFASLESPNAVGPAVLQGGAELQPAAEGAADLASPEVEAVRSVLRAAGLGGLGAGAAGAAANVREELAHDILAGLVERGLALALQKPPGYIDAGIAAACFEGVNAVLERSQSGAPWLAGLTLIALARALGVPEATLARVLGVAALDGHVVARKGYYASPGFEPQLSSEQSSFFDALFQGAGRRGNEPLAWADVRGAVRGSKIAGIAEAFDMLLVLGALVKVHDGVYRAAQVTKLRGQLELALRRGETMTMAAFRDLTGTSRKFAVPLLEWFDAAGVTVRVGDVRILRENSERRTAVAPEGAAPSHVPSRASSL